MIGLSDPRTTIVAIASATSPALRGAVRLAGDDALEVLQRMLDEPVTVPPTPSRRVIRLQLAPPLGILEATALLWPNTRSYTGCPSVEIHTVGSLPILEAIVSAAVSAGARPAGPGEFTLRAFLAGRLDLPQAEAVLGVIDATNRQQLDAALTQLAGNVSAPLREARHQLLDMLADLEAGLDFVEEDISFIDDPTLHAGLQSIAQLIDATATQLCGQRRSESFHWVVLRGRPNAGKSSLLNALAGQDVAIVSDQAGTTRDVVWKEMSLGGHRIRLADTAGIETGNDVLVCQAQRAAAEIQHAARIVILCQDARESRPPQAAQVAPAQAVIAVATKADLLGPRDRNGLLNGGWLMTSAADGQGLDRLRQAIVQLLEDATDSGDTGVPGTAARCADSIDRAANSLRRALDLITDAAGQEWVAAEMRQALAAIGEVTGEIYTDDILDRVFSRFCIGK